jgi:hypothetical protein
MGEGERKKNRWAERERERERGGMCVFFSFFPRKSRGALAFALACECAFNI